MSIIVISAKEEDIPALDYTLELIQDLPAELYVCFNAWGEDARVEWKEKSKFNFTENINNKNPDKLVESWNRGLRYAREKGEEVYILPLKWPGEKFNTPAFDRQKDIEIYKDMYRISLKSLQEIGVLDQNFFEKLYLLDYILRGRIKGLNINYSPDIPLQELTLLEQFDTLKLGTKWGVPEETNPEEFWEWAERQKYEWKNSMYLP